MHSAIVAFGANLGDVAATWKQALSLLESADLSVRRSSRLYATAPMGPQAGATYLNGALWIETRLDPLALLDRLQRIERQLGRVRAVHWGPRSIDLDLIFFDRQTICVPRLSVPHPASWYRRFVLDPIAEIVPDWRHPWLGETVARLRDRLSQRPLPIAIDHGLDSAELQSLLEEFATDLSWRFCDSTDCQSFARDGATALVFTERSEQADRDEGLRRVSVVREHAVDNLRYVLTAVLDLPQPVPAVHE